MIIHWTPGLRGAVAVWRAVSEVMGENHLCGLEVDDAFEGWNRVLAVGRDGGSDQKRVRQNGDSSQHVARMKRW